ncbi:hypothetical protein C2845_PM04G00310 [Panicum miliaceum]|uniref:Eukaryotic translation initiation factor 3 subunit D n=1 Tax=Panicum miliaceum TaxID=4540 RepID=A0A3L6QS61_PANMI|nr:hypothetical protein C2845_PM04G00310 [Panicum miliaceum]
MGFVPYNPDGWGLPEAGAAPSSLGRGSASVPFGLRPLLLLRQAGPHHEEEVEARRCEAEKERARRDRHWQQNRCTHYQFNRGGPSSSAKPSVDVQPEWYVKEQIPFSSFFKLSFAVADQPEDLLVCGAVEFYDRVFDRVTPRAKRRLERFKSRNFFKNDTATVFANDTILAALLCAPRSVQSWDIAIQRVGNKLFFDKRDGSQLDLLTVNETAQEPLPEAKEDINSAHSLDVEATYVNQNFSQQVLLRNEDRRKRKEKEKNPLTEGKDAADGS